MYRYACKNVVLLFRFYIVLYCPHGSATLFSLLLKLYILMLKVCHDLHIAISPISPMHSGSYTLGLAFASMYVYM